MKKKILLFQFVLLLLFSGCLATSKNVIAAGTAGDVIGIAASQVGYHEKASNANLDDKTANSGSANYNKYARDIGVANGQPWCATFVWWCMQSAGVPADKYPQVTYATRDWFRSRGLWHDRGTYTPKPGDYVAFGSAPDHCGIVESVSNGTVNTIEGNSSDQVIRHSYALSNAYIMGFGEIQYSGSSSGGTTVNTSNPGYPYAIPSGNIGQGSSGDGTRWIQTALNNLIGAGLAVDGIFGAGTKNAVVQFQSANGLAADGIVGNDTRNKMIAVWQAKQDSVKPVISNVKVSNKFSTGFVVECDVSDNVGVTKVQFPTWTSKNGQDDLKWVDATVSNGHVTVQINISDHNSETGPYITHIYAWDAAGNQAFADAGVISLPQITDGTLQNLGESFVAQITIPGSKALLQSGDSIIAAGMEKDNKAQQWKFTRNSDGTYFVNNLGNNKNMDVHGAVDANGTTVRTYVFNGNDAQKWYIYQNKSGNYYFVPKISKYRVMDRASSSGQMHLWDFYGDANAAQLFGLSMVVESTPTPVATKTPTVTPSIKPTATPSIKPTVTPLVEPTATPEIINTPVPTHEPIDSPTAMPTNTPMVSPSSSMLPESPLPTLSVTEDRDDDIINNDFYYYDDDEEDFDKNSTNHKITVSKVKNVQVAKTAKKIRVKWRRISGVKGYEIQVARNKSFTQGALKKKTAQNKVNITGFKKNKTYYIRIRAYKNSAVGKKYGKWSAVKKVKIKR